MAYQQPPSQPQMSAQQIQKSGRGCLLIFGLIWTAMSVFFLIMALTSGGGGIFGAVFSIPFVGIGVGMLCWALAPTLRATKLTEPVVRLTPEAIRLGEEFSFVFQQTFKAPLTVDWVKVTFLMRESATYRRGTDTYTDKHENTFATYDLPGREYRAGETLDLTYRFGIPPDAMHTFQGSNNKIDYMVKVQVSIARWPDVNEEYAVIVMPDRITGEDR
jgi:hypothetical protein